MDHVGPVLPTIFGYIRQLEAPGEVEVELHCGALPLSTDGVFDLHVDLRAIECPASAVDLVVDAHVFQGVAKRGGGGVPLGLLTDILFGAVGEEYLVVAEPECAEKPESEVENAADLVFQLVGAAEDMGVVLGEASDTEQAVEDTRPFRIGRRCPALPSAWATPGSFGARSGT